jgi:2-(1,2-epoxy-1,2-dihydrophenyl)acetyl-CoA isomerase
VGAPVLPEGRPAGRDARGPQQLTARLRTSEHPWGSLVELCAPDVRNALDQATVQELTDVFRRPGDGVVLLTGEGEHFCAGGDVSAMTKASYDDDLERLLVEGARGFAALVEAVMTCPRPVVAAVRGAAVGGGLVLALACDVRVAGRSTRLVPGWGRWGLPPDGGASALLAQALGPAAATSVLVTGDVIDAASSYAPLLFRQVVDDEQVDETAVALAEQLAASPGAALAKAVTRPLLLPLLRAQQQAELHALAAAAKTSAVQDLLRGSRV